jgi:hypothetical protein
MASGMSQRLIAGQPMDDYIQETPEHETEGDDQKSLKSTHRFFL